MKKAFLFLLIFVLFIPLTGAAYAQEEELEGVYYAKFSFANITTLNNSPVFRFKISLDEDYIATPAYLALVQNPDSQIAEPLGDIAQAFSSMGYEIAWTENELTAELTFDSYTDYYIANGIDGYSVEEDDRVMTVSEKGLLYSYVTYESDNIFKDMTPDILEEENIIGYTLNRLQDYGIGLENVLFEYALGTPYSNEVLDSTATEKYFSEEEAIYYHQILMDINNNSDALEITRRIPNTEIWYAGAALAGFAVAFIPLMIALAKRTRMQ